MENLAKVVRALGEGDYDSALTVLLKAWDETRAPELATVITAVSTRVTAELPKLETTAKRESLAAWVEVARGKRPSDVGRLLTGLVQILASGPFRLALPRLEALLEMPPDPRVADALLVALTGPITGWSDKAYIRTVKALLLHGDVRLCEVLAAVLAARAAIFFSDEDQARFAKIVPAWKKRAAVGAPSGLDEVQAALHTAPPLTTKPKTRVDGATLLAAIYADPSDEGRRQVYADYLVAEDDPRGEFMSLQLERAHRGGVAEKREMTLLKAHRTAWLGPIAAEVVIGETEWERGFPVAAQTKASKLYQAEAAFVRPEWATFERLEFASASLVTDEMRALREAYNLSDTAARRIAKLTFPPPRLHTAELVLEWKLLSPHEPAIAALLALPSLRQLELRSLNWQDTSADDVTRMVTAADRQLEHLILRGPGTFLGHLFAPILAAGGAGTLKTLSWSFGTGSTVTAQRDATGSWSSVEVAGNLFPSEEHALVIVEKLLGGLGADRFASATIASDGLLTEESKLWRLVAAVATRVSRATSP